MGLLKMKLTIFSRLIIGVLIIFILVIGMSTYAIVQMDRINEVTQSVLTINNHMIDSAARISDIIFSQVRYERKFIISKDEVFFNEFLRLKSDFDRYLEEMTSIADSSQARTSLNTIRDSYQNFQSLVQKEWKYLNAGSSYSRQWFNHEKEKARKSIIDELGKLETTTRQNTTDKIKGLHEIGIKLRRTAIVKIGRAHV